ncbi:MAG: hypothetical protein PF689_07155 [Deltaproteobacteria bacterium]|jgi:hypothetical protein|nr:hypothetical protein [Deltaproteobacteria bacterium]
MKTSRLFYLFLAISLFALTGCPSAGVYRTAHTLEKGQSDFGLNFNAFQIKSTNDHDTQSITIPNFIPELHYHIGVGNNMEIGGRVALGSMMAEFDFKYKFFESREKTTHIAVNPAVGYRSFIFIEGPHLTLPIIASYDLTSSLSITGFAYANYYNFQSPDGEITAEDYEDSDDNGANSAYFIINGVTTGAGVGIKYAGETFYIMPSVDFFTTAVNFSDDAEQNTMQGVIFNISFGWIGGKEMQKLNQMDNKLDRIEQNQHRDYDY